MYLMDGEWTVGGLNVLIVGGWVNRGGTGHRDFYLLDEIQQRKLLFHVRILCQNSSHVGCVRPLTFFYSDASADGVEERSLVLRSRSHARLRWNATMSHAFSCVQPAFIDL
ncbi:hypothetical protein EVAR_38267_1 [Eumeta japonica]|uniref:Uncharacterized protein n=1 Tax=Eumeta variegata TaxID=151549 RepID=A0A4C1WAI3_EUMVA|nr:hypothetical protein EVAR_38267_1 [Eumeta japonica]